LEWVIENLFFSPVVHGKSISAKEEFFSHVFTALAHNMPCHVTAHTQPTPCNSATLPHERERERVGKKEKQSFHYVSFSAYFVTHAETTSYSRRNGKEKRKKYSS
jgi:hypothetical protein